MVDKLKRSGFLLLLVLSLCESCKKSNSNDFDQVDDPFAIVECTLVGTVHVAEIQEKHIAFHVSRDTNLHVADIQEKHIAFYVPRETNLKDVRLNIAFANPRITISPSLETAFEVDAPKAFLLTDGLGNVQTLTVIVRRSPWAMVTTSAHFDRRDGAGLVEFNKKLWLIGGWRHQLGLSNEVWSSTDGSSWTLAVKSAPWAPRHSAGVIVFNNKLWVLSGDGNADVWSSSDGVNWQVETTDAPWGKRYSPYVAVFKGKIWLMGGISWWTEDGTIDLTKTRGFNDIWNSVDGKTWTKVVNDAPWPPRGLIHGFAVLNDELYLLGGGIKDEETQVSYNDVWKTKDGIHWTKVLQSAPWSPRTHFSVSTFNNKVWLTDGSVGKQSNLSNEVWFSDDGVEWTQLKHSFWKSRHASSLAVYNEKLWLVAGYDCNDVYVLDEKAP